MSSNLKLRIPVLLGVHTEVVNGITQCGLYGFQRLEKSVQRSSPKPSSFTSPEQGIM